VRSCGIPRGCHLGRITDAWIASAAFGVPFEPRFRDKHSIVSKT
jgi:hypothetical protein